MKRRLQFIILSKPTKDSEGFNWKKWIFMVFIPIFFTVFAGPILVTNGFLVYTQKSNAINKLLDEGYPAFRKEAIDYETQARDLLFARETQAYYWEEMIYYVEKLKNNEQLSEADKNAMKIFIKLSSESSQDILKKENEIKKTIDRLRIKMDMMRAVLGEKIKKPTLKNTEASTEKVNSFRDLTRKVLRGDVMSAMKSIDLLEAVEYGKEKRKREYENLTKEIESIEGLNERVCERFSEHLNKGVIRAQLESL